MTDSTNPDPPSTLAAAEQKLSAFLASQGYPKAICWLSPNDLLVDTKRCYWIRPRRSKTTNRDEQRYAEGLERNLGIELRAICATDTETFAHLFAPADDLDRQYHLMGRMLKLSCPVERRPASTTRNPVRWFALRLLNGHDLETLLDDKSAHWGFNQGQLLATRCGIGRRCVPCRGYISQPATPADLRAP